MSVVTEVPDGALRLDRFADLIGPKRAQVMWEAAARARAAIGSRRVWNVNSTAAGGGVAEMLQTLVHYGRGAGIDVRWLVVHGTPAFFEVTKRLHNRLHGVPGDDGRLDDDARRIYEGALAPVAAELGARIRPGEVVLLHDPQTAGLIPSVRRLGARVVWRCHVGTDEPNQHSREAWGFLDGWLREADAYVFSREQYVPTALRTRGVWVIPPSIDPFAVKNLPMAPPRVRAILRAIGVVGGRADAGLLAFERHDGSMRPLRGHASVLHEGPARPIGAPLVVQVSRWDRLKDMAGVLRGFVVATRGLPTAHLALVGPDVVGVSDDPEGAAVYRECAAEWAAQPADVRRRIALVTLPMADIEENAAMVNAIQRHAAVIVQKSLREGFGLTVTEAMWKRRPVIASRVGGIRDQITHDVHGLLVDDPTDLEEFAAHLRVLLENRATGRRLARNAYRRCVTRYLPPRHLEQYADLLETLLA
jgi:trehalose synthase